MKARYYFAYGSNCNLGQMAQRCPNAVKVGPATLCNYVLTFNGKTNGWGVANILRQKGERVDGLLWKITSECEESLDCYEGFPRLYVKRDITVYGPDGKGYKAMAYVMAPEYNWPAVPSQYYYNGIAAGFIQNGIPINSLVKALRQTILLIKKIQGLSVV